MKIIIVRHAQTHENTGGELAARKSDILLNEVGIAHSKKLAEHLKGEKISHAYVSPLLRAVHTAQEVLKYHAAVKLTHAEELLEQSLGIAETLPKEVFKEMRKASKDPWHLFKAEGGESYADLQARATKFFHGLAQKHPNDTVLVVSHGGPLGVLLLHILEKELTEENYRVHQPKNTEFTVVEISEDGSRKIHVLNSQTHLS